ncbi:MAG: hypothetical protein GX179_06225 [Candidatus Cloacimonetes bacterium]|uniref:Uncharacterized protein n=1 Tax=Cloacimonas acidaminovorans (strain Evry) TaxID=459349 RepID=B0VJA8_CLOAI|nr:hypothetical protein [Candidatus Cloacimonadota bacterium]CAO81562.1 hypothetical protein CLOAM1726 [Candidatus Cloacimonas acidaminovorans str. Evry]
MNRESLIFSNYPFISLTIEIFMLWEHILQNIYNKPKRKVVKEKYLVHIFNFRNLNFALNL